METIRKCKKCNTEKPLSEFYKKKKGDKFYSRSICKLCMVNDQLLRNRANPEAHRKNNKEWRNRNPEWRKESLRRYYQRYREEILSKGRRAYRANLKKARARRAVGVALENGTLTKESCWVCAAQKTEAHHPDYDKPLWVYWLCKKCHGKLHQRIAERNARRSSN